MEIEKLKKEKQELPTELELQFEKEKTKLLEEQIAIEDNSKKELAQYLLKQKSPLQN